MSDDEQADMPDDEQVQLAPAEQRTVDAASPRDLAKRKRKAKRAEQEAKLAEHEGDEFWRQILSTKIGRRECWKLLAAAHTFEERFVHNNGLHHPQATWFEAGRQSMGQLYFLTWLRIAPTDAGLMLAENDDRFPKPGKP